ncbi:MAG: hypothetical protein HYV26_10575, partial [Candidatus Hydrogenedentes bacterium]|nr:hypothetical protein [Candidatus Hydrogenedentota bacterium]
LALGYRSTVRYYTGASRGRVTGAPVPKAARRTRVLTGRRLPGFADDTASLCYAAFLSYLRHPNIRMLLIMPVCLGLFFLFVYGSEWGEKAGRGGQWLPYFVLLWPFLNFGYILLNVFGIDRESFRAMVLLPAPRHKYLLAKNVALFPFVGGLSLFFIVLGTALTAPGWRTTSVALLQVFQLYLLFCMVGNFTSILFPYRIHGNAMRGQTNQPIMILVGLVSMVVVALIMLPSTLCLLIDEVMKSSFPYGLVVSLGLLTFTVFAYVFSLRHAGDLLLEREQRVLETLVRDRE